MYSATALVMLFLSQSSWNEVKLAQSCLGYADCSMEVFSFPDARPGSFILSVKGMDARTAQARLAACGLGETLAGKVRAGSQPLDIPKAAATAAAPAPAGLHPILLAQNKAELKRLLKLGMSDPVQAGHAVMELFGLAGAAYRVIADPKIPDGVAQTSHQARTIRMNPKYSSPCAFWWAIRHELEHVAQIRFAGQCAQAGQRSAYLSQAMSEYDAYTGDLGYNSFACSGVARDRVEEIASSAAQKYRKARIAEIRAAGAGR